ncbi:P-loop containing nucleoside triphosphate hydrolase protein [Roridomyces roridus]|uniref:P-loop containing nucleoside triphosphate hydrolase protein n=1 Tax=Roridomyces roridus TaxID=1738132 RepID=A0AAD7B5W6_9AGAR|nr:P-loop containing nucleoside triphosphate hydrolase protein [Roridomyces roridus]
MDSVHDHRELVNQIVSPTKSRDDFLKDLGFAGLPSREQVHQEIKEKLLLPQETLPSHWLSTYQAHWTSELSVPSLLSFNPSPPPTSVSFIRTGLNERVTGHIPNARVSTGLTSTSMERTPGPSKNFVRGRSGHVPFWPGGLEDAIISSNPETSKAGLKTIPPGFTRGLRVAGEADEELLALDSIPNATEDEELAADADAFFDEVQEAPPPATGNEIDELLPTTRSNLKPIKPVVRRAPRIQKRDWAHVIDVNTPVTNFHELVPEMAHKYPFELDTFQKQAVYHLEMGDSVFVAAHTSAGKTVVAEYAIALAEKHMTRLSNQKFRDFKQTFKPSSVGILTGDVQTNPEASCLIMTTEILRSMLYKGADLIRDVEFVIFDEVHYVNDAERGVVWEEVIIMLPDHVNIILLSATVPNTKEFADWVGRTKKKDIYVISTAQRPVPLEHYLYAGREMYKIVDARRDFLALGYKEAGEALRRKQDKEREAAGLPPVQRAGARGAAAAQRGQQRGGAPARGRGAAPPARGGRGGGAPPRTMHHATDKNFYVHLVGHLRKKALLPVVVFTFSKKRCEENAATLTNADLCTSVEKSEVHVAIEKALSRLKEAAANRRGIGVHHGGLLPLVKEVVEILFARGLVKILFATETFAMGVNMPAKCVGFSGIRKHDGRSFRDILPGEYTQMAGRAGRRGLDPTGTVIIVANDSLPEQTTLQTMMLGTPGKLSSQFRLTYNMILNLLRVEALKVEEMIKRSFSENASQRLLPDQQKQVLESEKTLSSLAKLSCDICQPDINSYYDDSFAIVSANQRLLSMAVGHPQGAKSLASGRIVVLRDGPFQVE